MRSPHEGVIKDMIKNITILAKDVGKNFWEK
jgi:hypothetical protein